MDLLFSTFNARYSHTALALRYLRANLGSLHDNSIILEFDTHLPPQTAVDKMLIHDPQIILFSVYIWNLTVTTETVTLLRTLRPNIKIIIGGPEVSYEYESLPLFQQADHLVCGEGESVIFDLCQNLLAGKTLPKIIQGAPADLTTIALPYDEYTDEDIAHRRIYIETSRGCPFRCEYCLSSVESSVRFFPSDRIIPQLEKLIDRGVRIFKFLDRSFNCHAAHAAHILEFFLSHRREGMMLHLEWEPEHLPEKLKRLLSEAPEGFIQLEVGVQTLNPTVSARIQRPLHPERVELHIRILAAMPAIHMHADLIAGLPGETLGSFADGFNRLHACGPQEIQLGLLKKLRGTAIAKHDEQWQMIYSPNPPYEVQQTSALSRNELQQLRRFARYWDLTVNNGRFPNAAPLIWHSSDSVFSAFMNWSEWLYDQTKTTFGLTPMRLAALLESFLIEHRRLDPSLVSQALNGDREALVAGAKGMERQTRKKRTS